MVKLSKTQVDKLGERLKAEKVSDADITLLDEYRRSFGDAYDVVEQTIRNNLGLAPSGRPAKTTPSIIDKLRRESIRLSQIQDIAGCRIIVGDINEQNRIVSALQSVFLQSTVIDRRPKPSHGYRAVHLIVKDRERWVEIQVRTLLQHLWAQISEALSDTFDPSYKYGGGSQLLRDLMARSSKTAALLEESESEWSQTAKNRKIARERLAEIRKMKEEMALHFAGFIKVIESLKGKITWSSSSSTTSEKDIS